MKTIYLATYEGAKAKLENRIIESEARGSMLIEAIELLEPVLHYKNIDKRIMKALENDNFYSWIKNDFCFYVDLALRSRTFTNGDCFESYSESIYLDNKTEITPLRLKENIQSRLEQLQVGMNQYRQELANFKNIYNEAHKLASQYNAFSDKYSYALQGAIEI